MSKIAAVLMCGGSQTRMNGTLDAPKQLVLVDGVPNLVRTINILRTLADRVVIHVVAPRTDAWQTVAKVGNITLHVPTSTLFLESAFAALARMPAGAIDRNLVLCGDVVWSPEALQALVRPPYVGHVAPTAQAVFSTRYVPNIYTGRDSGEIFGFSFPTSMYGVLSATAGSCLQTAREMAQLTAVSSELTSAQADNIRERNCRLWLFMHMLEDRALAHVAEVAIDDYTDDLDSPEDIAQLPQLIEVIKART